MSNNERFLPHLSNSIPKHARNYMLSTYSIVLEAWRRGLDITIRIIREKSGKIEPYYSISDGKKTHRFSVTRGDFVSRESINSAKNKQSAKKYLVENNVPTPEGKDFAKDAADDDIIQYAEELGYPVVIKPLKGTGGTGVIGNIQNKEELAEALTYVRVTLKSPHIIIEKYFKGHDYRLYVLGDEVIAALKRLRAHVIGDGRHTIKQLINRKNNERKKLPALSKRPIKIDQETRTLLQRQDYSLNTIVPEGEVVYLKSKNNVSSGGDSVDVTDQVSETIKQIAIDATKSFPSLPQAGVDIMVDEENDTGVVIELNSRAHITQHLFPIKGQARDVPSRIIDYYFPETKNYNRKEANKLFLDYDFIFNASLSRKSREIRLPKISKRPIVLRRFILSNFRYTEPFAVRIRRIAYNHWVSGYIKPLQNGDVVIVTGGNSKNVDRFVQRMKKRARRDSKDVQIKEKPRTSPIKHGFHIEGSTMDLGSTQTVKINDPDIYIQKYSRLKRDYQKAMQKLTKYEQKEQMMQLTEKQNKQLKKRIHQLETSTSWKVTNPLRKVSQLIKNKD